MDNIICFHNPDEPNGFLSNWYVSEFQVNQIRYTSVEQYMMHQKALLFGDTDTAKKIMATNQVNLIKAYGQEITPYNDNRWGNQRYQIVYTGVLEKFKQNEGLTRQLLETDDAILAECAVRDCIWGIGLSMKDVRRLNLSEWRGENL